MAKAKTRRIYDERDPEDYIDKAGGVVAEGVWHAVMTAPQSEFKAQHFLRLAGYRTWLPYRSVRKHRKVPGKDQKSIEWVRKPLFSTYLFARVGPVQDVAGVNDAEGVSSVVYSGETPLRVPHAVMAGLMAMGDLKGMVGTDDQTVRRRWDIGSKVQLPDTSIFAGWVGTVKQDRSNGVRVFIESIEREVVVKADLLIPA